MVSKNLEKCQMYKCLSRWNFSCQFSHCSEKRSFIVIVLVPAVPFFSCGIIWSKNAAKFSLYLTSQIWITIETLALPLSFSCFHFIYSFMYIFICLFIYCTSLYIILYLIWCSCCVICMRYTLYIHRLCNFTMPQINWTSLPAMANELWIIKFHIYSEIKYDKFYPWKTITWKSKISFARLGKC
jgi:hypothetical protein